MTGIEALQPLNLEEFDAMEQKEGLTYELIDGIVMMSPRPSIQHQRTSGNLYFELRKFLDGKDCEPLLDVDLVLNDNHLIPDIMVVCGEPLEGNRCEKKPLIVIKILSSSSINRDHFTKRIKYEQLGIQEYWIASPEDKCIMDAIIFYMSSSLTICTGHWRNSLCTLPVVRLVTAGRAKVCI